MIPCTDTLYLHKLIYERSFPCRILLHIDTSIQGDGSASRRLTARAADRWRSAHPDGTVTYRDFAATRFRTSTPRAAWPGWSRRPSHTPAQAASFALSVELIDEVKRADVLLLGLPLYNYGPPSTVKAWVDHLVAPGCRSTPRRAQDCSVTPSSSCWPRAVADTRPGTPRDGWDHAEAWLPHGVALTGLTPRFITAELTLADKNPAMAELRSLAAESAARSETLIDELWAKRQVA